jgi:hypothetical protein
MEVVYFSSIYYCTSFQDYKLSRVSVTVLEQTMVLSLIVETAQEMMMYAGSIRITSP